MWNHLCKCEISDLLTLKTTHPGGGGFSQDFYVEGLHYTGRPGTPTVPIVELSLDVSPRAHYTTNPFPGDATRSMAQAAPHPRMHGLTHSPGGADPVLFPEGWNVGGGSLEEAYLTPGHLEGWWRLGEPGPFPSAAPVTPNWMADSSGLGRHGSAINQNAAGTAVLKVPATRTCRRRTSPER